MTTHPPACTDEAIAAAAQAELERRAAEAQLCRDSFADFVQIAIDHGAVDGIRKVVWGPHLDAWCFATQMRLESWLVAYGLGTPTMVERQRAAWERERPVVVTQSDGTEVVEMQRPTWEDGEPEPWLRYVLVPNEVKNCPPGLLKSTVDMICANAWIWLHCPWHSFGAASGIDANVVRDSKATRDLVKSPWYRETFAISFETYDLEDESTLEVKRDTDAVSDWATTAGGKRRSRTVNSGFTGTHVDSAWIDDADDADKVWNESDRLRPQNRFTRAIENRMNCEHRGLRTSLQQVVHAEGFSAYLLSIARWSPTCTKGWAWVCIPAEFGYGPKDAPVETPYGWREWRTEVGQTIHPMLSPGVLADKKLKMPATYEGQYNQNAARQVNGILARGLARFFVFEDERDRISTLRRRPEGCPDRETQPPIIVKRSQLRHRTLSVDANNTLEIKPGAKPSAVGLLVNAMAGSNTLVLDDRTRILDISGTYQAIYAAIAAWPLDEVLVELKAAGASVVNELRLAIRRGWYVDPRDVGPEPIRKPLLGPDGKPARPEVTLIVPKESKAARNQGLVQPWEQGTIFAHDGAGWLYPTADTNRKIVDGGFVGEVCSWRREGDPGDRLDALSQYVAKHRVVVQQTPSAAPIPLRRAN